MKMQFHVPSIVCSDCVNTIEEVIKTADDQASVSVNLEQKTVEVDSEMSEASVRQAITSTGHTIA